MSISFFAQPLEAIVPQSSARILYEELQIKTLGDLTSHFPFRYEDRSEVRKILSLTHGVEWVLLKGKISSLKLQGENKKILTAALEDQTAKIKLVWYKATEFHCKTLKSGTEYLVYGRLNQDNFGINMAHPEYKPVAKVKPEDFGLFPHYPTTAKIDAAKITQAKLRIWISNILKQGLNRIVETLPQNILTEFQLVSRRQAIVDIHFPSSKSALERAIKRLKFEELFFFQLEVMEVLKSPNKKQEGIVFQDFAIAKDFLKNHLPFKLTSAQNRVLKEIAADFQSGFQMSRLLQGDVGSGKTVVAFVAMLMAISKDCQALMMAPTEVLAAQHHEELSVYAHKLGLQIGLLTGSTKNSLRNRLHNQLISGELRLLIGTHALIEEKVQFNKLGLCIVDEQHRFGVEQRAKLLSKNSIAPPHFLLMSATPIPRTLALTAYGDLTVSVIDELPAGRKPIITKHLTEASRLRLFELVKQQLSEGRQAYIVYPAIEENEQLAINDLYSGFESLRRYFSEFQLGIVHGKMKPKDKEYEMQRFKEGKSQMLCATTVIEVGVNVPNASVMVIENAERFGLAQLHQLRGRVGRGSYQSYCYLVTPIKVSREVRERLAIVCQTNDGFQIADADLKLRGPGDLKGTQQSGLVSLRFTDLAKDQPLIEQVRNCVAEIYDKDPLLQESQHQMVRLKLEVMGKKKKDFSNVG